MQVKKGCCPVGAEPFTTGLAPEKRGLMSPIVGTCSNIALSPHTIIPTAFIRTEVFAKVHFLHRLALLSISSNLWSLTYIPAISNDLRTTRDFIEADQSIKLGFASRIVPYEDLMPTAMEIANKMISKNPLGLRLTKEAINQNLDAGGLEQALNMENRNQAICMLSNQIQQST